MTGKRIKDFYRFVRSVESFTDGQVCVLEWDEAALQDFKIQIQPNDGAYEGGRFVFTITLQNDFPESSPEVNCDTEIYHPNIDPTSDNYNVCLSLFDEWTSSYGLRDVIQGVLFLFYNPNVDDPLSSYFGDTLTEEEFEDNVRASLRGEDVEDYSFPWNYYGTDPEMLKHKPKTADKTENTETEAVAEEVEKEAINVENAKNVEKTEATGTVAELNGEKVECAENVENKEDDNENTTTTDDVTIVNSDTEAQDITVILEKVSELMLQYPEEEDDDKKQEKENTEDGTETENIEAVEVNEQEQNNFVNTDSTEDDVNEIDNENNPDGATENTDSNSETDNATATEVAAIDCPLQRQTSKIERQCSIKEMNNEIQAVAENTAAKMSSTQTFSYYSDALRTCSFATPEIDLAVNMFGVACYFVYKSFVK